MTRDLTVEEHSTWNRLALNCHTGSTQHQLQLSAREDAQHALHCLCLVSKFFISTNISSPPALVCISHFKSVLNKIGDSYQTYINTYKTHPMATHHRGAGQPLERALPPMNKTLIPQGNPSLGHG